MDRAGEGRAVNNTGIVLITVVLWSGVVGADCRAGQWLEIEKKRVECECAKNREAKDVE